MGYCNVVKGEGTAGLADETVEVFIVGCDIAEFDGGADEDHVVGDLGGVENLGVFESFFELADFGFVHALIFTGCVVFCVLAEVAELTGYSDAVGDCFAFGFILFDLFFE